MALTVLSQTKEYLGITDTSKDTEITNIMNRVLKAIETYTGRNLEERTYTDLYLNGSGNRFLRLPNYPIISITSIYDDDSLVASTKYFINKEKGMLILKDGEGNWTEGIYTIKITYTAGYKQGATGASVEFPKDLESAWVKQTAKEWQDKEHSLLGISSRSAADGSISYIEKGEFLKEVESILQRYKKFDR